MAAKTPSSVTPYDVGNALPADEAQREELLAMFDIDDEEELEVGEPMEPEAFIEQVQQAQEGDEDEDEEDGEQQTDEPGEADEEDEEIEDEEAEEEEPEVEDLPEDATPEQRYEHLRAMNDRRFNDMRRAHEEERQQWNEQLQQIQQQQAHMAGFQQAQHVQQQQVPQQQYTRQDIDTAVQQNPVGAYNFAMQNRPDLVPVIIAATRTAYADHEHPQMRELADNMQVSYSQALVADSAEKARIQAEQERAPLILKQGIEHVLGTVAEAVGKEDFERLSPRIDQLITENWGQLKDLSPTGLTAFVQQHALVAIREDTAQLRAKPRKARKLKPEEQIDTSNPAAAPKIKEVDEDDSFLGDVAAFNERRYQ